MQNIKLIISYDGLNYSGWQKQADNDNTVCAVLENVINKILNFSVRLIVSGRTDAGVSALNQVVNFEVASGSIVDYEKFKGRLNRFLPDDIKIISCEEADMSFYATSAKIRTYEYNFYLSDVSLFPYDRFCSRFSKDVDIIKFENAIKQVIGTHDFSAFCAKKTNVINKVRTIYHSEFIKCDGFYKVKISANGFLYNMIRIIIGTAMYIATDRIQIEMLDVISSCDRKIAGKTVPSKGLVLVDVKY